MDTLMAEQALQAPMPVLELALHQALNGARIREVLAGPALIPMHMLREQIMEHDNMRTNNLRLLRLRLRLHNHTTYPRRNRNRDRLLVRVHGRKQEKKPASAKTRGDGQKISRDGRKRTGRGGKTQTGKLGLLQKRRSGSRCVQGRGKQGNEMLGNE
jgi:hypothetical protein